MLTAYANDAGRKAVWTCVSCSTAKRISATAISSSSRSTGRLHTRRQSSSKASSSSKQDAAAITTATADPKTSAAASAAADVNSTATSPHPDGTQPKRSAARSGRRKVKESNPESSGENSKTSRIDLPSVPSTQNLPPLNVHLASFFSAHRPLSITNPIPPSTSTSVFSSIFEPKSTSKPSPTEILYALSSTVESLERASIQDDGEPHGNNQFRSQESDLFSTNTQGLQGGDQVHHLDDIPAKNLHATLQDMAKSFAPYTPPPPPVPLGALREAAASKKASSSLKAEPSRRRSRAQQPVERKSYKTTLTIHESTYANGNRVYETRSTPLTVSESLSNILADGPNQAAGTPQVEVVAQEDVDDGALDLTPPSSAVTRPQVSFLRRMHARRTRTLSSSTRHTRGSFKRSHNPRTLQINRSTTRSLFNDNSAQATQLEYLEPEQNQQVVGREMGEGGDESGEALPRMTWQLISVKRQRKLKMKKHKLKKLRKRTKNLRRKLDQLWWI